MKKLILFPFILSLLFFDSCNRHPVKNDRIIAILGAFKDEVIMMEDSLKNKKTVYVEGIKFVHGLLNGKSAVVAYTGIGKVNAAMTTSLLINNFHPKAVLFTGIAGGINPTIGPGDIVIGKSTVQHDLNYVYDDSLVSYRTSSPVNDSLNPVFFKADPRLLHLADSISHMVRLQKVNMGDTTIQPQIKIGIIATGDSFVASEKLKKQLISRFGADAVEMEGASVAQVCHELSVPCIVIRSISDSANNNAHFDIEKFLHIAATNAATFVLRIIAVMK